MHTKTCKRQNKVSSLICYPSNECTACGVNFPTHGELKTHLKDNCLGKHLQQSGSGSDIYFECKSCTSMKMNLEIEQATEHILMFCAINFRSKCIFCETISPRSSCTKHRQSLILMVCEKLDCKIFDLNNHRHRLLAHLYSIYKKKTLVKFHDNIIALGNYVDQTVELRPLVEIQSRAIIQTVTGAVINYCTLLSFPQMES